MFLSCTYCTLRSFNTKYVKNVKNTCYTRDKWSVQSKLIRQQYSLRAAVDVEVVVTAGVVVDVLAANRCKSGLFQTLLKIRFHKNAH